MPLLPLFSVVLPRADLPTLIPRAALFAKPDRISPQISPDGKSLALLRLSEHNTYEVWIRPLAGGDEKPITHTEGSGVDSYTWSADGKRILFFKEQGREPVRHLFSAELKTGDVRDLTPYQGVEAQDLLTATRKPDEALVGLNLSNRGVFDMYRLNLETGALTLDTKNPGDVTSWTADQRLVIRACSAMDPSDASTSVRTRSSSAGEWRTILKTPFEESLASAQEPRGTSIVGFNPSGRSLYVVSANGGNTSQLLRLDSYSGRVREEVTKPRGADIDLLPDARGDQRFAVVGDADLSSILAVGYNYQDLEWKVESESCKADFDALARYRDGDFSIISSDATDKLWVVKFYCPNLPTLYGVLDRNSHQVTPLFEEMPALSQFDLCPMKSIAIRTRDNQKVVGYLTTPNGIEAKHLPLILVAHDGPWQRDRWEFDPTVQFLANRGYAVLQVNYRGSSGYGLKFLNAGNGGWGQGAMETDLIDAANWAIAQGIADPARLAIMGKGYGGYAAMAGICLVPNVFACAANLGGACEVSPSTLPRATAQRRLWMRRTGLDTNGPAYPRTISPFYHAVEVRVPVLIGIGNASPSESVSQAESFAEEIRKRGVEAGVVRGDDAIDFAARLEEFFAKNLGGRTEP